MKQSDKSIIIISTIIIIVTITLGLLFIHNGYENYFIHKLPQGENNETSYDSLLNLYQTRVDIVNWGIACIGALLTFLAFYVQYQFNSAQKEDLARERFENKLFHLLDNYRDICNNTSLTGIEAGKTTFHYMFYEYKAIYNIISSNADIMKEITDKSDDSINYIAFTYFLNGVTASGIRTNLADSFISEEGDRAISEKLLTMQEMSEKYCPERSPEEGVRYIMDYRHKHIKYFDGHRMRLIPYIKYISLIIDFISSEKDTKEDYLIYLLSEQADHEIALLYAYNGFCKYRDKLDGLSVTNKTSSDTAALYEQMYNSLPKHMSSKFKYDSGSFIYVR